MGKLNTILGASVLLFSTTSSAAIIASFETTVSYISGTTTVPLSLGQTFNYELLFDTNADAFRINDVGTRIDMPDYVRVVGAHTYSYDQFYADLLSIDDNLSGDENNGVMEWNRGMFRDNITGTNHMTALDVGDMLEMSIFSIENQFDIGTVWGSHRKFQDPNNGSMFYNGTALLTAVREVSVPEPSIFALMFTGLIGLGFARRRARKA